MYIRNFWKVLPSIFTLDFWRVNPKFKDLTKNPTGWGIYKAKQIAKEKGYRWDNTWYLDGEKFLFRKDYLVCMCQPYNCLLTRAYAHMSDTEEYTVNETFLLNRNKTANFFFNNVIMEEGKILFDRQSLYWKINNRIACKGNEYTDSDEFLSDLHKLSMYNYYDLLELKKNSNYSLKEKKQFIGDFKDFTKIDLNDYISFEEAEEKRKNKEEYNWNWVDDKVPTALSKEKIDSILVINPSKIYGLKVTRELLERLHKKYF